MGLNEGMNSTSTGRLNEARETDFSYWDLGKEFDTISHIDLLFRLERHTINE